MNLLSPSLAVALSLLLATFPLQAQLPSPNVPGNDRTPEALQIRIVEPDASAKTTSDRALEVEVLDSSGVAVAQAAVVVRFAESSSAPTFSDGTRSLVLLTNDAGRARSGNVRWGTDASPAQVRVTASKGTAHAGLLYEMTGQPVPAVPSLPLAPTIVTPERITDPDGQMLSVDAPALGERPHVMITTGKHPGTLAGASPASSAAVTDIDSATNVPIRHMIGSTSVSQPDEHPGVSIFHSSSMSSSGGRSKIKWIAILAVAGGAAAAMAFVHKGSSASTPSPTTIGPPTVSLGHP